MKQIWFSDPSYISNWKFSTSLQTRRTRLPFSSCSIQSSPSSALLPLSLSGTLPVTGTITTHIFLSLSLSLISFSASHAIPRFHTIKRALSVIGSWTLILSASNLFVQCTLVNRCVLLITTFYGICGCFPREWRKSKWFFFVPIF